MGAYAGIFLGIAVILAWAVTFGPKLMGNHRLAKHVAITSGAYLVGYCLLWCVAAIFRVTTELHAVPLPPCLSLGVALLILFVYAVIVLAFRMPIMTLPVWSIFFLFLTITAPLELHRIAQLMWTGPFPGGSLNSGDTGAIDVFAMFLAIFLSILIWIAVARRRAPVITTAMSIGTLASIVLSGLAFYYTVPRRGLDDAGFLFYFFLIPAGILVAVITLVTCTVAMIVSLNRAARATDLPKA